MHVRSLGGPWVVLLLSAANLSSTELGAPQLVDAAQRQDREEIRSLLQQGADVNTQQADGATALHWAVHWDDVESARLLIRAGADVKAVNDYAVTPLSLACLNGSAVMVESLLTAEADPNAAGLTGVTPLMTAARTGSAAVVKALLAHGARVEATELLEGQTALMWAVSEGHLAVVQLLIEAGADVNARSIAKTVVRGLLQPETLTVEEGAFTPLHFAARQGDLESARLLLDSGANVNARTVDGLTALLVATVRGHTTLAKLLLEKGADPNVANSGFAAIHWAAGAWKSDFMTSGAGRGISPEADAEWGAVSGLQGAAKLDLIGALLAYGADPNVRLERAPSVVGTGRYRSDLGSTPFLLAARAADVTVMRILAAHGADPRMVADDNTTPLMAAAGVDRSASEMVLTEAETFEAVRLACELGCDVNAVNADGSTALHGVATVQANSAVQFLVDEGAKLNVVNIYGHTPLYLAEHHIHVGTAAVFVESSTGDLLRQLGAEATDDSR